MTSSNRMLVAFYVHLKVEVYYLCIWKNKLQTLTHSSKEPQSPASLKTLEVFRNEILAACQPASLAKIPQCWSDPYFWICDFSNKNQFNKKLFEVILISKFMNPEIRITSTLRYFCQAGRLPGHHFEKPLLHALWMYKRNDSGFSSHLLEWIVNGELALYNLYLRGEQ